MAFATDVDGDGLVDVVSCPIRDNPEGMAILPSADLLGSDGAVVPIRQVHRPFALTDIDGDGDLDALGSTLAARSNRFRPGPSGGCAQFGAGIAGAGGILPILGEVGPFRVGSTAQPRIRGGVGGAGGYLVVGLSSANVPTLGGTLLASPDLVIPIQLGGAPGVAGAGSATISWVIPPALAWISLNHQVGISTRPRRSACRRRTVVRAVQAVTRARPAPRGPVAPMPSTDPSGPPALAGQQ